MKPIIIDGVTQIRYVEQDQIDRHAWDQSIYHATNGLIYAYSYYLDFMADHWDALIFYNYEAVMPLPWRKKAGISYLYQPFNIAQLGVFGKEVNKELVGFFLQQVPKHFRYWDFPLNRTNQFDIDGFPFYQRVNYVLSLQPAYETIHNNYDANIKRNIRKCQDGGCRIITDVDISQVTELNRHHNQQATAADYNNFKKLYQHIKQKGLAETYAVLSGSDTILSSAVFFFSHNRAYYILVGNDPEGRNAGASHALVDRFIRDHAGRNLVLDFEGSDIEGLARFYRGFGAVEEKYPAIRLNRLPWWLKWVKTVGSKHSPAGNIHK